MCEKYRVIEALVLKGLVYEVLGDLMRKRILFKYVAVPVFFLVLILGLVFRFWGEILPSQAASPADLNNQAFTQVANEFQVPASLLKAICYMEGRLSIHNGSPSIDHGYGCMHLLKNDRADTLDTAAKDLGVSPTQLQHDIVTNIRGGADILRSEALELSGNQTLPTDLGHWYSVIETYSHASTTSVARMYADAVFALLNSGFSAPTEQGTIITLAPQRVAPAVARTFAAARVALPSGCVNDKKAEYSGAIDCYLDPGKHNCSLVPGTNAPCSYFPANRPKDYTITHVVIHDSEGTALDDLNTFQDPNSEATSHYIVDTDGTVYQVVHEKNIAFHAGNLWMNQHSIGIEHAGYDATGYLWYNATQYLSSAKLVAYLLKKYHIPLDHDHIVSHATVPTPTLATTPNHVDPGPYWLWTYYLNLIHQQGVAFPGGKTANHVITLQPRSASKPFNKNGTETKANFNFFYLYKGPSTASGLIPQEGTPADVTDVTSSVEADSSYYYLKQVKDPAGTGDTLYEVWYGVSAHAHDANNATFFTNAELAWLAVPSGAALNGKGTVVTLKGAKGKRVQVSGKPASKSMYYIGDAPVGSVFVSAYTVVEDGTHNTWYEINYNHRQAWVPASAVTVSH